MTELPLPEEAIFLQALEIEATAERTAFLDRACAADARLRAVVDALLRASAKSGDLLDISERPDASPTLDQASAQGIGTQIGPYKLLQQIGEGGMGTVYMAEQLEPVQRRVALKIIKPGMDSRQVIARFAAEKQALALMDHVNIARVLDAGVTDQGRPYFVMELVHGVPITKYCDDNHFTPRQRLELFVPVCQAIQHAHQKGIIHRDIKPSNVMITLYDGKPVPKVIDFGVAKATEQKLTEQTLFTQYGTMVGTLEYMSPEQAEMSALGVDTRSDIYSLGVLLYELLTGSTPLSRKQMKEVAYSEILRLIREEEPPRPSTRLSDSGQALASISAQRHTEPDKLSKLMRGELDWIVMKTLEKDRNRRYETANGFAADVQRYLADEPVLACPPSRWYQFRKFARRNRGTLAAVGVVSLALVLGTVVSIWQAVRAGRAEQNATRQRNDAQAQRHFARQAVDKMFAQVAEKWLSRNSSFEPVQKQILLDALQIYEELAKDESADPTLRLETGNAYRRMGEIYSKLGNLLNSERAFRKAQEILDSLVDQYPSEPDYRSALATAWHQYGMALHYSARMEDALGAYRQALLHREQLAAEHPDVPRYSREQAASLGAVANMLGSPGTFPESEVAYLHAIHLMETLPKEVADQPDCRFELGLLCSELAGVQESQGRGPESLPMFYRGKAVYEQLVSEFPRDPTYRSELVWALRQEGTRLADQTDHAEQAFRRALAIQQQLALESPTVPGYRGGLGQRYYSLGWILARAGRRDEAEDAYRQAARIGEQALMDFPEWVPTDFGGSYMHCHNELQMLLLEDGREEEAQAIYLRALEIYARLSKAWTNSLAGRWKLAEFRWELGKFAGRYGRLEETRRFFAEALSQYEQIAAQLPHNLDYQRILAVRKTELEDFRARTKPSQETDKQ